MKVIVLGAGVIGVTTAYYLAKQGAKVVVLDTVPRPKLLHHRRAVVLLLVLAFGGRRRAALRRSIT